MIFANLNDFWFFWKNNSQLRWRRHFREKTTFDTDSTVYVPQSSFLWHLNFFKQSYSVEKKTLVRVWEILLFNLHFTANLLQIGVKSSWRQSRHPVFLSWQIATKRKKTHDVEWMVFLSISKAWAEKFILLMFKGCRLQSHSSRSHYNITELYQISILLNNTFLMLNHTSFQLEEYSPQV